jgi:hypothetical protein
MVSTKYLLEVAEFSCLKSMFVDRVISLNCTSGPAVAGVTQKESPNDTTQRRAFEYIPMACLSNPLVANNSFAFLQDKKVIGVRVQKALLQASRPREIYASHVRGAAQTDS